MIPRKISFRKSHTLILYTDLGRAIDGLGPAPTMDGLANAVPVPAPVPPIEGRDIKAAPALLVLGRLLSGSLFSESTFLPTTTVIKGGIIEGRGLAIPVPVAAAFATEAMPPPIFLIAPPATAAEVVIEGLGIRRAVLARTPVVRAGSFAFSAEG